MKIRTLCGIILAVLTVFPAVAGFDLKVTLWRGESHSVIVPDE